MNAIHQKCMVSTVLFQLVGQIPIGRAALACLGPREDAGLLARADVDLNVAVAQAVIQPGAGSSGACSRDLFQSGCPARAAQILF